MGRNKLRIAVVAGLMLAALLFAAERAGALGPLNRLAQDTKATLFPRPLADPRIVLVAIDESSLAEAGRAFNVYWPWPREFFALVLDHLATQKPAAVVFDILYNTPDVDRLTSSGPDSDRRFETSLRNTGVAVLAAHSPASDSEAVIVPLPGFAQAAAAVGNTRVNPDTDGVIRSLPLQARGTPSLSLAAARTANPALAVAVSETLQVDWYRLGPQGSAYPSYRFNDVLASALRAQAGQPAPLAEAFRGKIIFFGATAAGLSDIKSTPISRGQPVPGVEIQMQATNNLLDGQLLRNVSTETALGLTATMLILPLALALWSRPVVSASVTLLLVGAVGVADALAFQQLRINLPSASWLSAALAAILTGIFIKYWLEERQALRIRRAFAHYVQPAIAEEIARHPEALALGGERREITLMFSDLAGFTTLSEKLAPEQLIGIMNEYFDAMTEAILATGGTVDKFIGDAVMAFWGAPQPQADHAIQACRAVLAQQQALAQLNQSLATRGLPPLTARFGINTGAAIVGNVGGRKRFNYTALGDTVNVAARLEPANTRFGSQATLSDATFQKVKSQIVCRRLGSEQLKGTTRPTAIYELLAARSSPEATQAEILAQEYEASLAAAEAGDVAPLDAFLRQYPADGPALKLRERLSR